MSKLLESYLSREVGFEKEIHAISETIEETEALMQLAQENLTALQNKLKSV